MTLTPIQYPSPNFGPRCDGLRPELVVLHYTAMETAEAALERLCSEEYEVSAHYLIAGDGRVWQMVEDSARAWHAGAGQWGGRGDVNSRSIGIELANTGAQPFAAPQMQALEELLGGILDRWSLPPRAVIGHSDMAPGRKGDPGPRFDWRRLARQGLSVWPDDSTAEGGEDTFRAALARFGYDPDHPDLLGAFRLRFRPWAGTAPLDDRDIGRALALADRYPALDPDRPAT